MYSDPDFDRAIALSIQDQLDHSAQQQLICCSCKQALRGSYLSTQSKHYHHSCFKCVGCNNVISESNFCSREEGPYHTRCSIELFSKRCCLCCHPMEGGYMKHPFFEEEEYCVGHNASTRVCFSCCRREPLLASGKEPFTALPDGRVSCFSCLTSAIFDSNELKILYQEVLNFFATELELDIPNEMKYVPVLTVDVESLNEQRPNGQTNHNEGVIRGLTLSSVTKVRHIAPGLVRWDSNQGIMVTENNGFETYNAKPSEIREVAAILVLFGMPRDLTASILAHEAMHVWLRLHSQFSFSLPPKVEEGLCQLIAEKMLSYLDRPSNDHHNRTKNNNYISDYDRTLKRMRKFFRFSIENEKSVNYGDGYREASACDRAIGLKELLEFIQQREAFPNI